GRPLRPAVTVGQILPPRTTGAAGGPVADRPGPAGGPHVLPQPGRRARIPRALLAVLASLPEPGGHRHRDPGHRDLALRGRRARPRPSVVSVQPAGLLDRAGASLRLAAPPPRGPPDRPPGRPDRTTPNRCPAGGRHPHHGRRGG